MSHSGNINGATTTLYPFQTTAADLVDWYCGLTSCQSEANTATFPGLQYGNAQSITFALLQRSTELFVVLLYDENDNSSGGAVVTVSGANSVDYLQQATANEFELTSGWDEFSTNGFIVSITKGVPVCYTHTSLTNIENIKYVQASANGDGETVGATENIVTNDAAAITANQFCITVDA